MTNSGYETPTVHLLEETGYLSIHQLIAYHTLLTVFKVVRTGQPTYMARRLGVGHGGRVMERIGRRQHNIRIEYNLSIARSGFMYRGAQLWNMVPIDIRTSTSISLFKKNIKTWIKRNISIRPQ